MKHHLFISYSDFDKDKVDLIIKELEDHYLFPPLVIAANRETLKSLAEKVITGIQTSTVFIPIISKVLLIKKLTCHIISRTTEPMMIS